MRLETSHDWWLAPPKKTGPKSQAEAMFEVFFGLIQWKRIRRFLFGENQHFQVPCGFFWKVGDFDAF